MKKGIYTALVTPFCKNNKIDYVALGTIIDAQINAKVCGVVALGTTAETPTLSAKEKKQILSFVIKKAAGKMEIVAGCGTNCTATTLKEIKWLNSQKIDAILLCLPAYNKPNFLGLKKHVELCAKSSTHPICLYYVPSRTGQSLSFAELKELCEIPNIVAIKDASDNLDLFFLLAQNKNINVYSGNDPQLLQTLMLGGSGIVSVASNAFPNQTNQIVQSYYASNFAQALEIFSKLAPILSSLFVETNPVPIKYILSQMGICPDTVRLPLGPLSQESKNIILSHMQS